MKEKDRNREAEERHLMGVEETLQRKREEKQRILEERRLQAKDEEVREV